MACGERFGRVDDLGEDADVVAGEVEVAAGEAEIGRQVDDLVRAALDRHAEMARQRRQIGAAAPGQDDAFDGVGNRHAALDDLLGHQAATLTPASTTIGA